MKILRNSVMTLLASATVFAATNASALPTGWVDSLTAWTATASSCSVDESSFGKYEFNGSQFRYLGTNISTTVGTPPFVLSQPIVVRCNVTPIYDYVKGLPDGFIPNAVAKSPDWNTLIVGYKDADGVLTTTRVSAVLKRVIRSSLVESTVATFDSNLFTSLVAHEDVKAFTHAFDFQNNSYYVELSLTRANTSVITPTVYSVRLANGHLPNSPF